MRTSRLAVLLLVNVGLLAGGASWVGCGSDTVQPPVDAGQDVSPVSDAGSDVFAFDGNIPVDCTAYCNAIGHVCTGLELQYLDDDTCKAMCAKLAPGTAGATTGNTLGCRIHHLANAAQSAQSAVVHCPHAGPYGFGSCGTEAEDFCALYQAQCGDFGAADCGAAAAALPKVDAGVLMTTLGNSLDCREYHLENAFKVGDTDGGGHCNHAAKTPGSTCL
jgi:hypothetical protein